MIASEKGSFTLILLLSVFGLGFSQSAEQRQASFAAPVGKAQEYLRKMRPGLPGGVESLQLFLENKAVMPKRRDLYKSCRSSPNKSS